MPVCMSDGCRVGGYVYQCVCVWRAVVVRWVCGSGYECESWYVWVYECECACMVLSVCV